MQAEWRDAAHTILALIEDTGHVIIVEPGHALWASASTRPDIVPFAAGPEPDPEPEDPPNPAEPAKPDASAAAIPPLTRRQLFIALSRLGLITAPEAVAAAANGTVPAVLEPVFAALPEPEQTDARVTFAAFQMVHRSDPMTAMIGVAAGLAEERIDTIWSEFARV